MTLHQRYMTALQRLLDHISSCSSCQTDEHCEDRELLEKRHQRLCDLLVERANQRRPAQG